MLLISGRCCTEKKISGKFELLKGYQLHNYQTFFFFFRLTLGFSSSVITSLPALDSEITFNLLLFFPFPFFFLPFLVSSSDDDSSLSSLSAFFFLRFRFFFCLISSDSEVSPSSDSFFPFLPFFLLEKKCILLLDVPYLF